MTVVLARVIAPVDAIVASPDMAVNAGSVAAPLSMSNRPAVPMVAKLTGEVPAPSRTALAVRVARPVPPLGTPKGIARDQMPIEVWVTKPLLISEFIT